jgi:hypothetical protein
VAEALLASQKKNQLRGVNVMRSGSDFSSHCRNRGKMIKNNLPPALGPEYDQMTYKN